jgi:ribose transport system ATP-binding protein
MDSILLEMRSIRKSFGETEVLRGVDFDVRAGEVHALVGENGAGKSTLMRIAAGIVSAEDGGMTFLGRNYAPHSPAAALRAGIAMVHQELSLTPDLTVAENILAGREPRHGWFLDKRALFEKAAAMLAEFCPAIDPHAPAGGLGMGYGQIVEVLKALAWDPKVIIFDEPTSALEAQETELVLGTLARLKARGVGVVYISHRLDEVFRAADRVTVLRDGARVAGWMTGETSRPAVLAAMVGRELTQLYPPKSAAIGEIVFSVDALRLPGAPAHDSNPLAGTAETDPQAKPGAPTAAPAAVLARRSKPRSSTAESDPQARPGAPAAVTFDLRRGEILGFSGLLGAGRTELMRAIFGADPRASGTICLEGRPLRVRSIPDAVEAGIAYVPEDRKTQGLFLDQSVQDNILAGRLDRCSRRGFVRRELCRGLAEHFRLALDIKLRDLDQEMRGLSGGNQQKTLLARWLLAEPKVLIVDEPTRGIDVGAKVEIHRLLREYADAGHGVIVVSSEMPELIGLCDRIIVLREGRLAGILAGAAATEQQLLSLAIGSA